jgi:ubiquinone/menaquinone biosynthesis C-methylase UbiE
MMGVATPQRALVHDTSDATGQHVEDLARYRFAAQFVAGCRVLDVACGTGYGSSLLSAEGKARQVIGVDASIEALESATRFRMPGRVEFVLAKAESLPFRDREFDAVVSMETFEHLAHPAGFLRELRRVLRPGGAAVVSTPLNNSPGRLRPQNRYHMREYSAEEFAGLLQAVFSEMQLCGQVSEFDYEPLWAPLEKLRGESVVGNALKRCTPIVVRQLVRRLLRSKGRHVVGSQVAAGYSAGAAYQIAVCT